MATLTVYYVLVFGAILLFGGSVIWALWWALRGGQFSDFARGATSIFDADEPIGKVTDSFPNQKLDPEDPMDGETPPTGRNGGRI
ncbi:MAG: hypothetical protein AMXMBFR13_32730 [Phycisphaerae bacterium]